MDKNQNLTSFQELTTTELNQITGGGWWLDSILDMLTSKIPDQANRYGNHQQMKSSKVILDKKLGSIIFVVGKSPIDIMKPILL